MRKIVCKSCILIRYDCKLNFAADFIAKLVINVTNDIPNVQTIRIITKKFINSHIKKFVSFDLNITIHCINANNDNKHVVISRQNVSPFIRRKPEPNNVVSSTFTNFKMTKQHTTVQI
ncbi:hypothetical protein DERP_010218 [Dermatophagoides pteronyssinus]|uniref:Uncharacterized protein n=1 Tax=Dermatophagoides pteronyssinus TaxID=6956 RepID=A0ABQ8J6Y4_DERPT|nr:hypothetical protein DERP_010218 [Dermatophagoides pteronyssinus]